MANNTNDTYLVWGQFILTGYKLSFIASVHSTDGHTFGNTFNKPMNASDMTGIESSENQDNLDNCIIQAVPLNV